MVSSLRLLFIIIENAIKTRDFAVDSVFEFFRGSRAFLRVCRAHKGEQGVGAVTFCEFFLLVSSYIDRRG